LQQKFFICHYLALMLACPGEVEKAKGRFTARLPASFRADTRLDSLAVIIIQRWLKKYAAVCGKRCGRHHNNHSKCRDYRRGRQQGHR
jgi:hypothetical protein